MNLPHSTNGQVKRHCEVCDATFWVVPSIVKIGRGRFCSRDCYGKWLSENNRGANHPNWQGRTVQRECLICGVPFDVRLAHVKRGAGKYCSWNCQHQALKGRRKYSSDADNPRKVLCTCAVCGEQFYHWKNYVENGEGKTCSRECMGIWRSENYTGENGANWRGGCTPYPAEWGRSLRESIRERDGRICAICGKTAAENGQRLDVHHIDYDKNNLDPLNLIALCQICHRTTNANRDFWQDNLAEFMASLVMPRGTGDEYLALDKWSS